MDETPSRTPLCVIIAGPNGDGKTTFAREFLPKHTEVIHFVNADMKPHPIPPGPTAVAAFTLAPSGLQLMHLKGPNYTWALKKWAQLWRTPDLHERVRISFSSRLRKSLGRVRRQSGMITLNARLKSAPRAVVLEILCHEAAHIAAFLLHGSGAKPHGPEWRELVSAAGYQPTTALKCHWVPAPGARAPTQRHHYRCPACQAGYFVRRRDSRLNCSACLRTGVTVRLDLISPP